MKIFKVATGTVLAVFLLAAVACNDSSPTAPSSGVKAAETNSEIPRMLIHPEPYRHIRPLVIKPRTPTTPPKTPTPQTTPTRTTTATMTPTPTPPQTTPTPPPNAKYDGTYDLTIYDCTSSYDSNGLIQCVGNVALSSPREFVVLNGNIDMLARTAPGLITGAVTDYTFGTVRLTGPCPAGNNSAAVYTGILNAGVGNKSGQGRYVCNGGAMDGYSNTWQVFNGN